MTTFYFIRHGNAYDEKGEQTPASPLNSDGRSQAEYLGNVLQGGKFNTILASPYVRAQETCQIATKPLNQSYTVVEDLHEVGSKNWPAPTERFLNKEVENEFKASVLQVKKAYDDLVQKYQGQAVLVFTHGNWIRVMLAQILGLDILALQHFHIDFVTVTVVSIADDGSTYISTVAADYAKIAKKLLL